MSQNFPTGGFEWVSNPEKLKGHFSELAKNPEKGYLLEVDMSYSQNLHDLHNDLLFMCEKRKINRVVPNLYNQKKCVIHCGSQSSTQARADLETNSLGE